MSLTDERIEEIADKVFLTPNGVIQFARAIEQEVLLEEATKLSKFLNETESKEPFVMKELGKPCVCGEPSTSGVVHRTEGPCYVREVTGKQEPSSPGAFEEWYDTKFKHGFERGPNDKYVARKAWFAALASPQPCQKCAELEKEVARLKTVPMMYRRMAFNAQLQDENTKLTAKVAELETGRLQASEAAHLLRDKCAELEATIAIYHDTGQRAIEIQVRDLKRSKELELSQRDSNEQIVDLRRELARYKEREKTMGWNQN